MRLDIGFGTHQGRVRRSNEDSVGVFQPPRGFFGRDGGLPLFVVADGMGGHLSGEIASRLTVQTMGRVFAHRSKSAPPGDALQAAILAANDATRAEAASSPERSGMGSTVVAATFTQGGVFFGNVGDSRAYLIRGEGIRQVTEDHSLIAEQVRMGNLTQEQAATAEGRNIITRAIGRRDSLEVDIFEESWQVGDAFLLCSDGLWGQVSEAQMLAILFELPAQPAVEKLVQMAMTAQAPDNISVVVVRRLG